MLLRLRSGGGCSIAHLLGRASFSSSSPLPSPSPSQSPAPSPSPSPSPSLSSPSSSTPPPPSEEVAIYRGEFGNRLVWLRRVSFGSSMLSMIGIPVVAFAGLGTGSVPFLGQVMIVGTALFTSLSSTAFLHLVTRPYCVSLVRLPPPHGTATTDPVFRATRVNLFGNLDTTEFTMKDAVKISSGGHPFASVNIKSQNFYIFGGKIDDVGMRRALSNEH